MQYIYNKKYIFYFLYTIMFKYDIISKPDFKINTEVIDNILYNISNLISKIQKWTLNIVFLDDKSIQKLNKQYRNIDKSTDVLSFHYFDDFNNLKTNDIAWEIILSEKKIVSQAIKYWLWKEKEFYKLLIHSTLHILWYDHENDEDYLIMNKLENQIFETSIWLIEKN